MDKSRLIFAVHRRTAITLSPDDPAFAQAELIRSVLEAAFEEAERTLTERLEALTEKIVDVGKQTAAEISADGFQRVMEMLRECRGALARDTEQAQQRITQQFENAARVLARNLEAAVRAAQSTKPNAYVHAHMLGVGAAIAVVFFALGALTTWSLSEQEAAKVQTQRSGPVISRPRS
ncbi:MAG TPA: hypothetical protein VGY54_20865 [Polyangiaceae bacterium]|jgi:hypothetical protein|nr:hypothetical protein [Polyangiaceae bacterium]